MKSMAGSGNSCLRIGFLASRYQAVGYVVQPAERALCTWEAGKRATVLLDANGRRVSPAWGFCFNDTSSLQAHGSRGSRADFSTRQPAHRMPPVAEECRRSVVRFSCLGHRFERLFLSAAAARDPMRDKTGRWLQRFRVKNPRPERAVGRCGKISLWRALERPGP
jgi:hypothetical protein